MSQLSCFEREAHGGSTALPLLPEISSFEMIMAWISDIYDFFKSLTLLAKLSVKMLAAGNKI